MVINKKGFTLLELLIVIALLGALAVGLLAALDPFEQLKKGTDTGVRNTVAEFQGSVIRFFALKGNMPFCDPADPTTCNDPTAVALDTLNTAPYYTALDQVINSGELKSDFATLASSQMAKIFVTGDSTANTLAVCYSPTSKSFQADANTKFDSAGVEEAAGTCKSDGGAQDCFWCVK